MDYIEERGDFVLRHQGDQCVLEKYRGPGGGVTVPEDVTEIGSFAFNQCIALTGVVLPKGVTAIGLGAFRGCACLTGLVLPPSLREIGPMAFTCCVSLTHMELPQGVRELGSGAFHGCLDLKTLVLPRGMRTIGGNLLGPWHKTKVCGMVPLMMEGCRIGPSTLVALLDAQWTGEDDFFEAAAAYLGSGRRAVMERAQARLCTNTGWAVEVLADLLSTYPTARHFAKGAEFVKRQAPDLWPEAFETFRGLARASRRRKALRRLEALGRDVPSSAAEEKSCFNGADR